MEQSTLSFKHQYSSLAPMLFEPATKLTYLRVYLKNTVLCFKLQKVK